MAMNTTSDKQALAMNPTQRAARIAELEALQQQPQNASGMFSNAWRAVKIGAVVGIGAIVAAKAGTNITKALAAEGKEANQVGKFFLNNKKTTGAVGFGVAGTAYMHNNRDKEATNKIELELAKLKAIQQKEEERLNFQNTITAEDLARRDALNASGQGKADGISGRIVQQRQAGISQGV